MTDATTSQTIRSTVSKKWLLKIVLIAAVLIGFGGWGFYDAAIKYPSRGERASEWLEYQYLDQYGRAKGVVDSRAGISDHAAELARIATKLEQSGRLDPVDESLKQWLESLALVRRSDPATSTKIPRTDFRGDEITDAKSRYEALSKKFTASQGGKVQAPTPLSAWDIPVQWLITAAGFGIGLYMLLLVLLVKTKTFTYDAAAMRLTLPGGNSFVPQDIEDVDKRLWHKFYVTIRIKSGHAQLGGRKFQLDLMRYEPVESWILEMERAAFPDRAEKDPPPQAAEQPAPSGSST